MKNKVFEEKEDSLPGFLLSFTDSVPSYST